MLCAEWYRYSDRIRSTRAHAAHATHATPTKRQPYTSHCETLRRPHTSHCEAETITTGTQQRCPQRTRPVESCPAAGRCVRCARYTNMFSPVMSAQATNGACCISTSPSQHRINATFLHLDLVAHTISVKDQNALARHVLTPALSFEPPYRNGLLFVRTGPLTPDG